MEQSNEEILISIRRQYEDKEVINALYKLLDEKNNLFKELRTNFGVLISENDELKHNIGILKNTHKSQLKLKEKEYLALSNNISKYRLDSKKIKSIRKTLRKNESENLKLARVKDIVFKDDREESFYLKELNK